MSQVVRDLTRGRTVLQSGGGARSCRGCGATVFFARNVSDVKDWIRFNDREYRSEHVCGRHLAPPKRDVANALTITSHLPIVKLAPDSTADGQRGRTLVNPSVRQPHLGGLPIRTIIPLGSLQHQISRAGKGQSITVDAGRYEGPVAVMTDLAIAASSSGVTLDGTTGPVLTVVNCDVTLDGFTIRSSAGVAILVESSGGRPASLRLRNCTIEARADALRASGSTTRIWVENCYVTAQRGVALALPDHGKAMVHGSMLSAPSSHGIAGGSAVIVDLKDCAITECGGDGIRLGERSQLWMDGQQGVDVTVNGGSGIVLGARSQGKLQLATVTDNAGWGLVATNGRLDLERCLLSGNGNGETRLDGDAGTFHHRSPQRAPRLDLPLEVRPPKIEPKPAPEPQPLPPRVRNGDDLSNGVVTLRRLADLSAMTLGDPRFRWLSATIGTDAHLETTLDEWVDLFVARASVAEAISLIEQLTDYVGWLVSLPLDEELASVVAPLVPAADVEAVLTCFGWSGGEPRSFEETARRVDTAVERVSDIVLAFIVAAQEAGIWTPTLDRVVAAVAERAPVDRAELNAIIESHGLLPGGDVSIDALFDADDIMSIEPRLETIESHGTVYLIRREESGGESGEEPVVEPNESFRKPLLPPPLGTETGRSVARRLRKLLAVVGAVSLEDVCEQLGRGTIDPIQVTPDQLTAYADSVAWLTVEDDIVRSSELLLPEQVLNETELTLVELVEKLRPGADTSFLASEILPHAFEAGLTRERTYQLLANSPLFRRLDRGRYELFTPEELSTRIEAPGADRPDDQAVDPRSDATFFEPTGYRLGDLVDEIDRGVVGLPDLQRPFVWKADRIRDLFDSMYRGFPIGYLLLWHNPIPTAGRSFGARADEEPARVVPDRLVVDGQQRLTSLWATVTGQAVINADYERQTIRLAFDPLEGTFIVATERTARNPRYVPDIGPFLSPDVDVAECVRAFLDRLTSAQPVSGDQRVRIDAAIRRLARLRDFPLTGLVLSSQLDVQQVADVFVRINSKGVRLDQGDFVLTLMSVYWEEGRRQLEAFCRSAQVPAPGRTTAHNPFITPRPTQLLTVAVSLAFRNARLRETHAVIGGEEANAEGLSVRDERFTQLADAQSYLLDLDHWHGFFDALRLAGYVSGGMITSQAALLYAYAFYLIGRRDFAVPADVLERVIARWVSMSLLTGRYSSGANTRMDNDLAQLRGARTADDFVAVLEREIAAVLTDDYWTITLPNLLLTTSTNHLAVHAYDASLNAGSAPALFGPRPVSRLFDPTIRTANRGVTRMALFSKQHLAQIGVTDPVEVKQVANLAIVDNQSMPGDMKASPSIFMERAMAHLSGSDRDRMTGLHALPPGWTTLRYADFLERRRKAMAMVIRGQFERLRNASINRS